MNNIIRYIVMKNEEVPAFYSTELGQDVAYAYAKQNAVRYDGTIFSENSSGQLTQVEFRRRR